MPTIDQAASSDPKFMSLLADLNISNREIARQTGFNESSIRRWRARQQQAPYATASVAPTFKNGTAQWVPGIDLGQTDGEIRTLPHIVRDNVPEPADVELMEEMGIDPEQWEIVARRESRWQSKEGGDFLKAHKLSVRRRSAATGDLSVETMNEILTNYHGTGTLIPENDSVFVVPVGDLQVGKVDGGGTPALIERFARLTDEASMRLVKEGGARRLVLPWLGDCIEGIVSQHGKLATRLDVSVTEQVRIYRRLMLHQIASFAPHADHVIIPVLPGNHDETSRQFSATSTLDSWAIEGASAVEDALRLSGKFPNVTFVYPQEEELALTVNVGTDENPFTLGFTHGHLASSPAKTLDWWRDQSHGRQVVGQADILFTGHFHHLRVEATGGGRTWIQIPALDGGSDWFRRSKGVDEPAGMMSLRVTPGEGIGWEGLTVHS